MSTSSAGTYSEVYNGSNTSYTNSGLSNGKSYYYKVKATNSSGSSSLSGYVSGTTLTEDPDSPTAVSATDGTYTDRIRITWNSVLGATRYYVYRSTSSSGTYSSLGYVTGLYRDDTSVTPGTTYYYKVKAYNNGQYSSYSGYDSGWRGIPVPTVSATDGTYTDRIRISWNSVSGATRYYVYRSTSSSGTYSSLGYVTGLYKDDTSVTPGTTYYYKVRAYNNGRYSAYSSYDWGVAINPFITLKVTFEKIYVYNDGDATGNGELYYYFSANEIEVDKYNRDNPLSVNSGYYYTINKSVTFVKIKASGENFRVYFWFKEADVLFDDELHEAGGDIYISRYYYYDTWGIGSHSEALIGDEANIRIYWKVERVD